MDSFVNELLERNQRYADARVGDIKHDNATPRAMILTCVDFRLLPGKFLGLEPGEVFVIRTAGARVTPEGEEQVALLSRLVAGHAVSGEPPMELVIIQHTDCAMSKLTDTATRESIVRDTGISDEALLHRAIHGHDDSLAEDIERLRASAVVPSGLLVSGLLYDVATGGLRVVVPPQRLD